MPGTILFLCTGNYYRSRFAEELFNSMAAEAGLDWTATSRALAIELGIFNAGPISVHAQAALAELGINLAKPVRHPIAVTNDDLTASTRVIALKEAEHRPYLTQRHPDWPDRVEYWHIHDLDQATPKEALAGIAVNVSELVEQLKQQREGKK
jgi:protein-tyrosine phosphatase